MIYSYSAEGELSLPPLFRRFCRRERVYGRFTVFNRVLEENHMSDEKPVAQTNKTEQPHPFRPLGLKAVIAAALMLKPKQAIKPAS